MYNENPSLIREDGMTIRVRSIFGTRPEAIKMAPMVRALEADVPFSSRALITSQHREMLDGVLNWFEIVPDYDLSGLRPAGENSAV